ncbi:MAG: DUF4282 domain-containing protein [Acidimicrobiales bacterium]
MEPRTDAGFLKSLYDFSFSIFVTSKIIRVLYIIITIVYSLVALLFFIDFARSGTLGLVAAIVLVPLGYLLSLTLARIMLELVMVVFRIGEDLRVIRDGGTFSGTTVLATPPFLPPPNSDDRQTPHA